MEKIINIIKEALVVNHIDIDILDDELLKKDLRKDFGFDIIDIEMFIMDVEDIAHLNDIFIDINTDTIKTVQDLYNLLQKEI